ncbi:hypothetical protein IH785_13280, partial [candidate division KSB1 bacterium]|nr:hypothetical protein [candidate division KSB1 bacterium]
MRRIKLLFAAAITMFLMNGLVFAQDTTLTVTSDGNVGIGITNPGTSLEVAQEDASTNTSINTAWFSRSTTGVASDGIGVRLELQSEDDAGNILRAATIEGVLDDVTAATPKGSLRLGGRDSPSALVVDNSGNVGIGTTAPA